MITGMSSSFKTSTNTLLLEFCCTPEAVQSDLRIRRKCKIFTLIDRPLKVSCNCIYPRVTRQSTCGRVKGPARAQVKARIHACLSVTKEGRLSHSSGEDNTQPVQDCFKMKSPDISTSRAFTKIFPEALARRELQRGSPCKTTTTKKTQAFPVFLTYSNDCGTAIIDVF